MRSKLKLIAIGGELLIHPFEGVSGIAVNDCWTEAIECRSVNGELSRSFDSGRAFCLHNGWSQHWNDPLFSHSNGLNAGTFGSGASKLPRQNSLLRGRVVATGST